MNDPLQRRSQPRNKFRYFARFRVLSASAAGADRLCVTQDLSNRGLYFVAFDRELRLKMQLLLRFPYLADSSDVQRECFVEVVRMQPLFAERYGVAVKLISQQDNVKVQNSLMFPEIRSSKRESDCCIDFQA